MKIIWGEKIIFGERQKHIKCQWENDNTKLGESSKNSTYKSAFSSGHKVCDKVKYISWEKSLSDKFYKSDKYVVTNSFHL